MIFDLFRLILILISQMTEFYYSQIFKRTAQAVFIVLFAVFSISCDSIADLAGLTKNGVVTAKRAQVRSSVAVVAADLLEVKRGEMLDILDEMEAGEGTQRELWYNIRMQNDEKTEGWIEARNVLTEDLLEKSRKLSQEDKDMPAQAAGQLRAATNLRLITDLNPKGSILRLDAGSTFEIVGWKRVEKIETDSDKDDKNKATANANTAPEKPLTPRQKRQREADEREDLDEKYDTWYKVRLSPAVSPAPAGWIFGRQVELQVPSDIIFFRTGREFVAWSRLDGEGGVRDVEVAKDKDAAKEIKPGSWVVLERSRATSPDGDEPDFDRVLILGYDKIRQEHYKVYRSGNIRGYLPLKTLGEGDSRVITVKIKGSDGQLKDYQIKVVKDARSILKAEVPPDMPKDDKSDL